MSSSRIGNLRSARKGKGSGADLTGVNREQIFDGRVSYRLGHQVAEWVGRLVGVGIVVGVVRGGGAYACHGQAIA